MRSGHEIEVYIYFSEPNGTSVPFYSVRVGDHKLERLADVNLLPRGPAQTRFGIWTGMAPDDSSLMLRDTSTHEIYALELPRSYLAITNSYYFRCRRGTILGTFFFDDRVLRKFAAGADHPPTPLQ